MGAYSVHIIGLSNKVHHFDYEIGDKFFSEFGSDLVSKGTFQVGIALDKRETFIDADFSIKGTAKLICDRSLEAFDYPIENHGKIVFKYGDTDEEMSDEIVMIHRDSTTLELGQYIFEFIALAVPMKKLHPRFENEAEEENEDELNGKIVYQSGGSESDKTDDDNEAEIDPRWNILKKLK